MRVSADEAAKPLLGKGANRKAWLIARFAVLSFGGLLISIFFLVHPGGGSAAAEASSPVALESAEARVARVEGLLRRPLTEAARADLRTVLPDAPEGDATVQFSGYVKISETKHMFYLLVLAAEDPATAPLAWWSNGGPGCSGLIGYSTEHGPYRPLRDSTLGAFPYSWNRKANMLYVESPVGVGFSYSTDATGADYEAGDHSVARDNYDVLVQLLERHPQFKDSDLYLMPRAILTKS